MTYQGVTMPTVQADASNFADLLQIVRDGHEIFLTPGEYKGPFTIDKSITVRGSGTDTVIWAVDEPALVIKVPGVRLENLAIERTVGGDTGAVVLSAGTGTSPILNQVKLRGVAENVQWEGASWDISAVLDFGEIETNRQVERSWQLQVGAPCEVLCDLSWVQVKTSHLSPGVQNLEVVLDTRDVPAGTNLAGAIFLGATDGIREIAVAGKIKKTSSPTSDAIKDAINPLSRRGEGSNIPALTAREDGLDSEDWGYRFQGAAVEHLIREIEGKAALESYVEFTARRNRAEDIMSEILGDEPRLFYVRRKGQGQDPGEEKWELTIATDRHGVALPAVLEERGKTLSLLAVVSSDGYDNLQLLSARLVPPDRGQTDGFAVLSRIRLRPSYKSGMGVPRSALIRMAKEPVCGEHVPTEEQLQAWTAFVEIERRIAEARQFCVPFLSHNYGASTRRIVFEIEAAEASIDGSAENSLAEADFWQRAFQARNEEVKLFKSSPEGRGGRDGEKLGRIAEVDSKQGKIRVMLDSDLVERITEGHYQLPATGFLFFEAFGEISQIKQKERALSELRNGRSQNPYLGEFLFEASQARSPRKTVKLRPEDLLLPSANPDQIAAVEAVLSAPDMVLIQGPPGTGKTTVIAEICYQVALRGGRTLIASQANLAVDNALSRLVHNPAIRALRKGKADKVQEEGQPFLEEQVIGKWLGDTAGDCEKRLAKRRENVDLYRQLLASSDERFANYLQAEEALQRLQKQLQERKETLEANCEAQEQAFRQAEMAHSELESPISELESLLSAARVDWEDPAIVNLLSRLQPYVGGESSVQSFMNKVKDALKLAKELGFEHPRCGAFGLGAWLRETVAASMSESRTALAAANDAATALTEFEEAVRVDDRHSACLNRLRSDSRQLLEKQKNLEQQIGERENQKASINSAIKEVDLWLHVSPARVYNVLKRCLQERQPLTDYLLQLPPSLRALAQSANLRLVPSYGTNPIDDMPDWEQLGKALSYEAQNGFGDALGRQSRFSEFLHRSLIQPPMVLSAKHQANSLEIAERFTIYPHLSKTERQLVVESARLFFSEIQQVYAASWERKNIESTLNRLTQEVINTIINARTYALQVKAETEKTLQHLGEQLDEVRKLAANLNMQGSAAHAQAEIARQEAEGKFNRVVQLLQTVYQLPQVPERLRILSEQCFRTPCEILPNSPELSAQVRSWQSQASKLETLISTLDPFAVLSLCKTRLNESLSRLQQEKESAKIPLAESQSQLREIEVQLQQHNLPETLMAERTWWQEAWDAIPARLKPTVPSTGLFTLDFLRQVKAQFDSWHKELAQEEAYLSRYENLVQDWIEKLRHPLAQDRNELKQIYLDSANVIGITCVQAARREFSEEFKNFDVVIIDEVSKCTPPELLIPALKGKKLVLVGDHRQLPPMLNDSTVEDIAQEMGIAPEKLSFLEESLFKLQFEAAADSIKRMLTVQYRMHPSIMAAINQFYQHRLQCGLPAPDQQRAHNLAGAIIQEHQHLIWVKMPLGKGFEEQKQGTSPFNVREVDVIERLCQQMEAAWAPRIALGEPRKEIGIITFYLAQLELIDERLDPQLFPSLHIRTGTVDRFQGMERQVVIVSMVRNNREGKVGFAKKPERVNVAFSRAQELLVIVGCHSLFTQHPGQVGSMYSEVSNVVRRQGGLVDVSRLLS
jgi:DNA polymerase III delta prime subunit